MKPPSEPHGILAHYFVPDEAHRVQGALTPDEWARELDAYGARLISADEWMDRALQGELTDEVCVTFDDGLREAYVYAKPALDARGICAAWNVYTQPLVGVPHSLERWRWVRNHAFGSLEKFYEVWRRYCNQLLLPIDGLVYGTKHYLEDRGYLSQDDRDFRHWRNEVASPVQYEHVMTDLERKSGKTWDAADHWLTAADLRRLLHDGHVIGLHGHRHFTVAGSLEEQRVEWATSAALLRGLGIDARTASYPCGQITDAAGAWFKDHGIQLAWGATMKGAFPWECPRWSTGYWHV